MRTYWIALAVVVLDQLTKNLVKHLMSLHQVIRVWGNTVQLTYLENPGMAFGIRFFEAHRFWGRWFFSVVSVAASAGLIWYLYRMRHERTVFRMALALILGGAVGNLIDRILYGRVVDFVDVDIPDIFGMQRWPVFNIADSAVVCGMILMTLFVMFARAPHPEGPREETLGEGSADVLENREQTAAE